MESFLIEWLESMLGLFQVLLRIDLHAPQFYIANGWTEFINRHELRIADFVVFEVVGNLYFIVVVFRGNTIEDDFRLLLECEQQGCGLETVVGLPELDTNTFSVVMSEYHFTKRLGWETSLCDFAWYW